MFHREMERENRKNGNQKESCKESDQEGRQEKEVTDLNQATGEAKASPKIFARNYSCCARRVPAYNDATLIRAGPMETSFLFTASLLINVIVLIVLVLLWKRSATGPGGEDVRATAGRLDSMEASLSAKFTNLAVQIEKNRGDFNLELTKQLADGLAGLRTSVDTQLVRGREEQATSLKGATSNLETKFDQLTQRQAQHAKDSRDELAKSLENVRAEVDKKLNEISGQVQTKLNENIKEGFKHFEKVQEHLKAAEEQLRNVGTLGESIHDLNSLLKLPHLRGKFGEASLERLLADFLPAHMFTLQMGPDHSSGRADAMIHFPERNLPIDAKFPREQVLALFESNDQTEIEEARKVFVRVMKEQAKRVRAYIQPENGTTDMALLYLPSETLYMEVVRNRELSEDLNKIKVFPVSPNTLLVTLSTVAMVHKWYTMQKGLAKSIEEFGRAQKSFSYFESKFEVIGKSLEKAQEAFTTASGHLTKYKNKVVQMTGEEVPELAAAEDEEKSSAAFTGQ